MADTHVDDQVKQLLEFYFGSSNLRRDKFLRAQVESSRKGFVPLKIIAEFNRIKALHQTVSDLARIGATIPWLRLTKDRTCIGRRTKANLDVDTTTRTVYVENLPANVNHDSLKQWMEEVGQVELVELPRYQNTNQYKGFAFVEYKTEEAAEKAVKLLNSYSVAMNRDGLRVLPKSTWVQLNERAKEIKRSLLHELQVAAADESRQQQSMVVPGSCLRVENIGSNPVVTAASLGLVMQTVAPVRYVDYHRGNHQATVRFKSATAATAALKYFSSIQMQCGGKVCRWRILSGKEEEQYHETILKYRSGKYPAPVVTGSLAAKHGHDDDDNDDDDREEEEEEEYRTVHKARKKLKSQR